MEFSLVIVGFLFLTHVSAGIFFPGELGSALGIILSSLPSTKIGTDSRLGFGFRLGRNADAQFLIELGPQSNTIPLQQNINRKRDITSNIRDSFSGIWKNKFTNRYKYNVVTHKTNLLEETTKLLPTTEKAVITEESKEKTIFPIDLPIYLSDKFLVSDRITANFTSTNSLELIKKYKHLYPVFNVNVFKLVNSLMNILPDSKT